MSDPWVTLAIFLALAFAVPLGLLLAARVARVRSRVDSPLRREPYESGEPLAGPSWVRFHPRYYLVALVFVVFDVEAVFLLPWGVSLRQLGLGATIETAVFVGILMLGWAYAIRKGTLRWR